MESYDYLIVGAGPAGCSSAIYAARYMLKTIVIGQELGGTAAYAHKICNFPSYNEITGAELMQKIEAHVKALKVPFVNDEIADIEPKAGNFIVKTRSGRSYKANKVLIAVGTKRRALNIAGEDRFLGRGVSYCATCDAPFFKKKIVAVIGGSDAALTAALLLSEHAAKVYLIHRKDSFSGNAEPTWINAVKKNKKITIIFNEVPKEILGKETVEKLALESGKKIALNGVFVEIGSIPNQDLIQRLGLKNKDGFVLVDGNQKTNISGIYAAGDITFGELKQVITACSQGAKAAFSAYQEISGNK